MADALFAVHLTLSEFTGVEELQLEKSEADDLSSALKEYGKFKGMHFDPEKVALFNLCVALGRVYIPRGIAFKNRRSRESAPAPAPAPKVEAANKPNGRVREMKPPSQMSPSEVFGYQSAEL